MLVVVYSADLQVLLLERADKPGYWQSVTGAKDHAREPWRRCAERELAEETGLRVGRDLPAAALDDWQLFNRYPIYPEWRHRYAAGVTHNLERVFGLRLPAPCPVLLAPREHVAQCWLPWREAADRCGSASNAEAILQLPRRLAGAGG